MRAIETRDKRAIERFLRREIDLNLYAIGDLDPFFWPHTRWFALGEGDDTLAIALLYGGLSVPTLLALSADPGPVSELVAHLLDRLPDRVHAHLSPGVDEPLRRGYDLSSLGVHFRMSLVNRDAAAKANGDTVPLTLRDLDEIRSFYAESYPDNWFDARMLETGQYVGARVAGHLVSVAGVHVYSPEQRVAALGNIATHPAHRRAGHGTAVTARLCRSLLKSVDHIGLNVHAENLAAIRCYERLGFAVTGSFEEFTATRRSES